MPHPNSSSCPLKARICSAPYINLLITKLISISVTARSGSISKSCRSCLATFVVRILLDHVSNRQRWNSYYLKLNIKGTTVETGLLLLLTAMHSLVHRAWQGPQPAPRASHHTQAGPQGGMEMLCSSELVTAVTHRVSCVVAGCTHILMRKNNNFSKIYMICVFFADRIYIGIIHQGTRLALAIREKESESQGRTAPWLLIVPSYKPSSTGAEQSSFPPAPVETCLQGAIAGPYYYMLQTGVSGGMKVLGSPKARVEQRRGRRCHQDHSHAQPHHMALCRAASQAPAPEAVNGDQCSG